MSTDLQDIILLFCLVIINLSSFIVLTYEDVKIIYTHWRKNRA